MLAALGVGTAQALAAGGARLADLADDGLHGLVAARERFRGRRAGRRHRRGPAPARLPRRERVVGPQKGATPEEAQQLEGALGRLTEVAQRTLPPADRPAHRRRPAARPRAGRRRRRRARLRPAAARRPRPAAGSTRCCRPSVSPTGSPPRDLVVTGEAVLDWQSLRGTVVAGVAAGRAGRRPYPPSCSPGRSLVGRRETMALGISGDLRGGRAPRPGAPRSRPTRRAPWPRAPPGWRPPGPRAATARRTLEEPGTHPGGHGLALSTAHRCVARSAHDHRLEGLTDD